MQLLAAVALFLLVTQKLHGQDPTIVIYPGPFEVNLNYPNYNEGTQLIPLGIDLWDGNEVNTIYYGKTPPNSSNKPVIVFVHGYASNAQVFFLGDDNMYADVYRDGYRSAYVSLTPNDDMWTNGSMLATMIDQIKDHYSNAPLVLVGWSKGGVDIDAALVHFGANDQVSEVFTLSTPHYGTGIAELANSVLLSLVNIIFMQDNDATLSLQRGYMNYFRSITDNNPNNTVPYTTIGGWGNGPLNRLDIPQGILHLMDGSKASGGNDGVVPYASSIRPGAKELFDGLQKKYGFLGIPYYDGPNETNLDHYEVTRGGKVWPYIKRELEESNRQISSITNATKNHPNRLITSNMQMVWNSENDFLFIGPDQQKSNLIVLSENGEPLELRSENGKKSQIFSKKSPLSAANEFIYEVDHLPPGKYYMPAKNHFAILEDKDGTEMILNMGNKPTTDLERDGSLGLYLSFKNVENINDAEITAYLTPTSDLALNRLEPKPIPLKIIGRNDQFSFQLANSIEPGIYQLIIHATSPAFKRDLITSIAITNGEREIKPTQSIKGWSMYPNPARDEVTIHLDNALTETKVSVYTMKGELIYQADIPVGNNFFTWQTGSTDVGLYLVEIQQEQNKQQKMLVIMDK